MLPLPCDPSIHSASASVRKYLRERLRRLFEPLPKPKLRTEGFTPRAGLTVAALRESGKRSNRRKAAK